MKQIFGFSEKQHQWFSDHPEYAVVQPLRWGVWWVDQGYLWADGKFSLDDGKTLFWKPYEAGAVRVGRAVEMV